MTSPELKYYSPLRVEAIAVMFGMSKKWVYDHWAKLGGKKIGGTIFFTEQGVRHALQGGQVLESHTEIQRNPGQNQIMPDKKRSLAMGNSREKTAERDRIEGAKRHGLINDDGKIS